MKRFSLLVICLMFANSSFSVGPMPAVKIDKVAFQNNNFFLYSSGWNNPSECTRSTAVVLQASDPNFDKAYSLLLAAYMSGKRVSGYSDDCIDFDGETYNMIRGFKYLVVTD